MESLGRLLGVEVPCCHDALSRPIRQPTESMVLGFLVGCVVEQSQFIERRALP